MKDLIARIKGYDYKGFFLRHGEKIGMGLIGAIVLAVLALTSWSGYGSSPAEMANKAQDVESKLRMNNFPESKRSEFGVLSAEGQTARLSAKIELAKYDHDIPMSPKLWQVRLAAEEPEVLPPVELLARSGVFALAEAASLDEVPAETESKGGRSKKEKEKPAPAVDPKVLEQLGLSPTTAVAPVEAAPVALGPSHVVRYIALVCRINRRAQLEKLKRALHLDTVADAASYLEYLDFKVQRQRAQPGDVPFPAVDDPDYEKSWKDIDVESSREVLYEAADFDAEIIPAENTSNVVTSPLPHRIDGRWEFAKVGHPAFVPLDESMQEVEQALNATASEVAVEEESPKKKKRRGFADLQQDANLLRAQAVSQLGTDEIRKKMNELLGNSANKGAGLGALVERLGGATAAFDMMRAQGQLTPDVEQFIRLAGGAERAYEIWKSEQGKAGSRVPAALAVPGSMMLSGSKTGVPGAVSTGTEALLLRFLDFDVEPGECYRYRVKLVIRNPSFGEEFVASDTVALGEERESQNWSGPSTAAAVDRDIAYALAGVSPGTRIHPVTELEVVQHDSELGTLVSGTIKVLPGQYVGATRPKTKRANPLTSKLAEEDVTFVSREVLADSSAAHDLLPGVQEDLKLSAQDFRSLQNGGALDQALTISRFGEFVALDVDSKQDLRPAKQRYLEQNANYESVDSPTGNAAAKEKKQPLRAMANPLKMMRDLRKQFKRARK